MWIAAARRNGQDGTELWIWKDVSEGAAATFMISDPSRIAVACTSAGRNGVPPVRNDEARADDWRNCSLLPKASKPDAELCKWETWCCRPATREGALGQTFTAMVSASLSL